ncbi:hypothetical protein CE91St41_32680 [Oscillospiraceae bacterium]|nr:hypothetical protein CE91St40_32680 [Oscillospiraceae bacterium]BDF76379.1 hypothetical protein CE91St41_32680 [Oscillospiraceae bacterium]
MEELYSVGIDIGTSRPMACAACHGGPGTLKSSAEVNSACGKSPLSCDFTGVRPPHCGAPVEVPL